MNNIIDDYINNEVSSEEERRQLEALKADPNNHQTLALTLKLLISKDKLCLADQIFENSPSEIKKNNSLFYPIALVKMLLEKNEEAYYYFNKHLEIDDLDEDALFNYGILLNKIDKIDEAIEVFKKIVLIKKTHLKAYLNLGVLFFKKQEYSKAIECYNECLNIDPECADAHHNLGSLHEGNRDFLKAFECYTKALNFNKNHVQSRWNRALLNLREGNYTAGFSDFEVRLQKEEIIRNDLPFPEWKGEDLSKKTLFIYTEQGYGDFIQYIRFIKLLRPSVKTIVLEVKEELRELLNSFPDVDFFHTKNTSLPEFKIDFKVALMSLPHLLKIDMENLLSQTSYLLPSTDRIQYFEKKLSIYEYKIGFVWTGNKWPPGNNIRHTELIHFKNLAKHFPDITFISLQLGEDRQELKQINVENLIDITDEIENFNDTSAILKNLDLLITIDTSIAHLGGALGIETWLLLSSLPDWRWLAGDEYSLWYPTIKIYRQIPSGDWKQLFSEIALDLRKKTGNEFEIKNIETKFCNLIDQKKFKEAIELFENFFSLFSDNYEMISLSAQAYEKENKIAEAEKYYEKSFELKNFFKQNLLNYSLFLLKYCKYQRGLEIVDMAVDMFPVDYEFYYLKALFLNKFADNKKSLKFFEKALEKSGNKKEIVDSYSQILNETENSEKVIKVKRKMIENTERQPVLTLSMIIKNEEKFLEDCLNSVKGLVDEIVIVDTGSTDNSLEIAKKHSAKIFHFDWINDFAAARNFALKQSSGKWILYLDADERLDQESIQEIKTVIVSNKKIGVFCNVISYSEVAGNTNKMKYARLFKNSDEIEFEGRVHEQIEKSLTKNNYDILDSNIKIVHLGYDQTKEVYEQKARRNLQLLLIDYSENPKTYVKFQIGQTYVVLNEVEKGIPYFEEVVKDDEIDKNYRLQSLRFLGAFYVEKNKLEIALKYVEEGLKINSEHHLLNIILAEIFLKTGNFEKSEKYFLKGYSTNLKLLKGEIKSINEYAVEQDRIILRGIQLSLFLKSENLFMLMKNESSKFIDKTELRNSILYLAGLFSLETDENNYEIRGFEKYFSSEMILNVIESYENLIDQETLLRKFASIYPNDYQYKKYFADVLFNLKKFEESFEKYYSLHKKFENDPEIFLKLLAVYFNLGKKNEIIELLEKGETLFNDFPKVLKQIESIKSKI